MLDAQRLRKSVDDGFDETNIAAVAPDADDLQAARFGGGHNRFGMLVVDIDDRRAAGLDQRFEQPELGGEISLQRRMIIEMVARDVGEGRRRDAQAVETILIEPVRGRLDREMRDTLAGQRVERSMQRDRIRRGQRSVGLAARRDDADGADARGAMAECRPDLPRERGDGGLAARAGDGGDGLRLARKKSGRHQRQRAPGIADAHKSIPAGSGASGRRCARMAAAPAAIAGPTNFRPSVLPPSMATKMSPLLTARESADTPLTSRSGLPVSIVASGQNFAKLHGGPPGVPNFEVRKRLRHVLMRTSESKGTPAIYDSSAVSGFEVPIRACRLI